MIEDELSRTRLALIRPVGWMSLTQRAMTELQQQNGYQIISANPDTWKIGKTTCVPADYVERLLWTEEEVAAFNALPRPLDPIRPRYMKCTADVYLLQQVTASDWCTLPDEDGNIGCKVITDVTDGDYDAFDNTLRMRRQRQNSADHEQEFEPQSKAQHQQGVRIRDRRYSYLDSDLHPKHNTVRYTLFAGMDGPFVWPAGGVTFANRLQEPISVLLDNTTVDIEGFSNGETFGLATVVDIDSNGTHTVAPGSWSGDYNLASKNPQHPYNTHPLECAQEEVIHTLNTHLNVCPRRNLMGAPFVLRHCFSFRR